MFTSKREIFLRLSLMSKIKINVPHKKIMLSLDYSTVKKKKKRWKKGKENRLFRIWFDWTISFSACHHHLRDSNIFFLTPHLFSIFSHSCHVLSLSASHHLSHREQSVTDKELEFCNYKGKKRQTVPHHVHRLLSVNGTPFIHKLKLKLNKLENKFFYISG